MKLKIKLPLLFLAVFLFIFIILIIYIRFAVVGDIGGRKPLHNFLNNAGGHEILTFLLIVLGIVFLILIVYLHFKITKPIQVLNKKILDVNVWNSTELKGKKARKDEIGELQNNFYDMKDKLFQARKEQIDMITAIAHDIKTPLTSITGFIELLFIQENLSDEERCEYYELILKKSKHITELISDFSAFTKEELELYSTEIKQADAKKLFENIAEEYETELSGLNHELICGHSFRDDTFIFINEHMIRRVFGNIFSNAVRYGDKNNLKVYMKGYAEDNFVYFEIEDNGKGVPDKDLPSLFQIFYTVDKSRQREEGGMGLGLASCKSIIERHGGKISAFHSEHGGIGIRFSIPLGRQ